MSCEKVTSSQHYTKFLKGINRSFMLIYGLLYIYNKKRRNATKPGFQRFNQVLIWQE